MATPRKHWFRVADSVSVEPWSNDVAATFLRLGGVLNTRWARDGKDATEAARILLRPADLMALTGSGSLTRARRIARELATHVGLVVDEQGTNTSLEWRKFAEFQRYESRVGADTETDAPPELPSPQDAPARRKKRSPSDSSSAMENDPIALKFAEDFRAALVREHPGIKPPSPSAFERWVRDARLLLAERGAEHARETARWLFDTATPNPDAEFWRGVILGVPKFRQKFDQLVAKRRTTTGGTHAQAGNHTSDLAERARAIVRERNLRVAQAHGGE